MGSVLAVDLGASSGRAILGELKDGKIALKEVNRFPNKPIYKRGILSWNTDYLFSEIKKSIMEAKKVAEVESIGVDTWGVDFGLLDEYGNLIAFPANYRDSRTKGILKRVASLFSLKELYKITGNQIMEINTLFQLLALREKNPELFYQAKTVLLIPDLFNYLLTGKIAAECSIASTTQLTDPHTKKWSKEVLDSFELSSQMFPEIVNEGNFLGTTKSELGLGKIKVINVCQHDTASAVVSVPFEKNFLFISCGTWSLIGTELNEPILNEQAIKFNLTNESGHSGTTRLLKNCTGLWVIQELKRNYEEEGLNYSYEEIANMASLVSCNECIIDTDDESFLEPGDMRERIISYAKKTNQKVPKEPKEFFRCAYESLAYKYKETIKEIEMITNKKFEEIYIVGGGAKATFFCQLVANITGKEVIAGPGEATAIGNIVIQLIALKEIKDVSEARKIISNSFNLTKYIPGVK
ncbi:MAG: rhamnulokinase family protein [Clostridium perfringens]|nr:rhamnulokinase family protein [Clostridium perfringens]MDU6175315.1 rhamnulokinase family protein [Clostridium perfringens]